MKKAPLIGSLNISLVLPPAVNPAAASLFDTLLNGIKTPKHDSDQASKFTPPAVGEVWPDQGGIYFGLIQYPEGLCHVIAATEDLPGQYPFGANGESTESTSRTDGRANTQILLARKGKHPAAISAAAYTADGHSDFALPSIGELHRFWQVAPESFATDCSYWSSSQRSAYDAFGMGFGVGYQFYDYKLNELRVRPVRRLPIQ